eukprot:525773-Pleurochrysis_carterae.AAC.8
MPLAKRVLNCFESVPAAARSATSRCPKLVPEGAATSPTHLIYVLTQRLSVGAEPCAINSLTL